MNASSLGLVVITIACLLTFCAALYVLRDLFPRGPALLVSACVALLGFLGLTQSHDGWVEVILLPYATLAVSLLLLFVLALLGQLFSPSLRHRRIKDRTELQPPGQRGLPAPQRRRLGSSRQPRRRAPERQLRPREQGRSQTTHGQQDLRRPLPQSQQPTDPQEAED